MLLYWQIGRDILNRQQREGWGAEVIERLAQDLRNAFPDTKGLSPRNLKYMRSFAEAWPDDGFVQGVLAQLPWYHQLALLDKLNTSDERRWYAAKAIEHNWSRNVLVMQIETRLLERSGQAVSNIPAVMPKAQSDLARESLKDPRIARPITTITPPATTLPTTTPCNQIAAPPGVTDPQAPPIPTEIAATASPRNPHPTQSAGGPQRPAACLKHFS